MLLEKKASAKEERLATAFCDVWKRVPVVFSLILVACGGGGGTGRPNSQPVADAGQPQLTLKNVLVVLDGSASQDADADPLTFRWSFVSKPVGSAAVVSGVGASATFTPDVHGDYLVGLVANDGKEDSAMATVAVTARDGTSSLHDTGLAACFSASAQIPCPAPGAPFYGQDATYSTNVMRFVFDGSTVTDALTGLNWQRVDVAGTFNWYEASGTYHAAYNPTSKSVCGAITLAGHTDWRLPSRRELLSITNYTQGSPDPSVFSTGAALSGGPVYWTSTHLDSSGSADVWLVRPDGQVHNALRYPDGLAAPNSVECVRGNAWGLNAFVDRGNGTVSDSMSSLQWQQVDDGVARTWESALDYCENLSLAGYTDWRLPDVKELESMVYLQSGGFTSRIDSARFTPRTDDSGLSFYWSSTTMPRSVRAALGVEFFNGSVDYGGFEKTSYKFVRCVR